MSDGDETRVVRPGIDRVNALLGQSLGDSARRLELGDSDGGARCLAFLAAQSNCRSPLPSELLEVVETFEDLMHFVAVRESQETAGP
jgi:hypothetical protein